MSTPCATPEIDTAAVLHAALIAFLEGALLYGVFHGDLHGGNLFVRHDGRVALLDFGITGRLDEPQRLAFLRLIIAGSANDIRGQVEAMRDLGRSRRPPTSTPSSATSGSTSRRSTRRR